MKKGSFKKFDSDWLLEQEKKMRDKKLVDHKKMQEFKLKKIPDSKIGITDLSKNKKVKNAVKSEVDGVKFDSNLERDFYFELKRNNIEFEFKHKFILVKDFLYDYKMVRTIVWNVDFYFKELNLIIDTKGWATDVFNLKIKLFKNMVIRENLPIFTVLIIKNKQHFNPAIICIKERMKGKISEIENNLII
jgi:hypothetical protein